MLLQILTLSLVHAFSNRAYAVANLHCGFGVACVVNQNVTALCEARADSDLVLVASLFSHSTLSC